MALAPTVTAQAAAFTTQPMISAGGSHTLALHSDGTVWAWGFNGAGQLGQGQSSGLGNRLTPVQVVELTNVTAISAGGNRSAATRRDNVAFRWGASRNANNVSSRLTTPMQAFGWVTSTTSSISTGAFHVAALFDDGTVWAQGDNGDRQLGDGTNIHRFLAVQVNDLADVTAISAGLIHNIALRRDGTVWTWGRIGEGGEWGVGFIGGRSSTPVQVNGLTNIRAISAGNTHNVALRNDGTVWTWGLAGQRGDFVDHVGNRPPPPFQFNPVQVSGLSNITAVSAGNGHFAALHSDGTVWTWGSNEHGQLGDGTTTNRLTPVQVSGLTNVSAISAGCNHTVALRGDSTVWAWGLNSTGQLGDGTTTNRNTPTQVAGPGGTGVLNLSTSTAVPEPTPTIPQTPTHPPEITRPLGYYDRTQLHDPLRRPDGTASRHFRVEHVVCGHGHANSGPLYNCPVIFPFEPRLVYILDRIADYYYPREVRIRQNNHSGFRCYAHNTALHHAPDIRASYTSNHRDGRAADISIAGVDLRTLYGVARRYGAAADTYIGGSFVHIAIPELAPRTLTINSPVDVFIYDSSGRLVGRIIDNVVDARIRYEGISISVGYNNVKYMSFFTTRNYTVRVVATGHGTMTYTVEDFNVSTMQRVASRRFANVALRPGREFVSEITAAANVRLYLVESDRVVGEIATDGTVSTVGPTAQTPEPPTPPPPTPSPTHPPLLRFVIGQTQYTHLGAVRISDATPFITDDRTMVPLRIIAEALGADVGWNAPTRTVSIVQGGRNLNLIIDIPLPDGMGTPVIVNGRTFVPVRYVSEMLGASVRWDGTNRAVYVYQTTGGIPPVTPPTPPTQPTLPPATVAPSNPANVNVGTERELRDAVASDATIITLVNDIAITRALTIDRNTPVTITGSFAINRRDDSRDTININNSTHVIWDGPTFNGTIYINYDSSLTIQSGGSRWLHSNLPNTSIVMYGGLVHIVSTSGNFTMRGGEVYTSWPRDGTAINLSAVSIWGGEFNMYGGTISAGATCGNMSGVLIGVRGGSFNMHAGTIRGFERGVVLDGRSDSSTRFILRGGSITASNVGLFIGRGFSGVIELRGGRLSGAVNDIENLSDDIPTPRLP